MPAPGAGSVEPHAIAKIASSRSSGRRAALISVSEVIVPEVSR
jgi:hypothetical protein